MKTKSDCEQVLRSYLCFRCGKSVEVELNDASHAHYHFMACSKCAPRFLTGEGHALYTYQCSQMVPHLSRSPDRQVHGHSSGFRLITHVSR
jgi:hypothetical protein